MTTARSNHLQQLQHHSMHSSPRPGSLSAAARSRLRVGSGAEALTRGGRYALAALAIVTGLGCGDDPVQPPPPAQLTTPRIAFSSTRTGTLGVHLYDPASGQIRRVSPGGTIELQAAISPDGRRIAFVDYQSSRPRIMTMAVDGSDRATCTSNPTFIDTGPHWSPDSKRLAFTRTRTTGEHDVYTVGFRGDGIVRVTTDGRSNAFDWSPDGTRLLVGRDSLFSANPGDVTYDMVTMNPDGSDSHSLFGVQTVKMMGADYSPDGTRIVFTCEQMFGVSPRVEISNSDGSNHYFLLPGTDYASSGGIGPPSWSPDGSTIVISARADLDTEDLYTLVPDGSDPVILLGGDPHDVGPDWGPKP